MMGKLQEMKGAVDDSKKRLENIYVKGETQDGSIRFVMDWNRRLKDITITPEAMERDIEEIQDLLVTAFNKALEDADHVK